MKFKEELYLLIKSKYNFVWVTTLDEDYVSSNINELALSYGYKIYFWSVTKGLWVGGAKDSFYDSNDLLKSLKLIDDIISNSTNSIFVLYDIDKYFDKPLIVRYIKDILSKIKSNSITIIAISPNHLEIKDFENYAAEIHGGFPNEGEIVSIVNDEIKNYSKTSNVKLVLDSNKTKRFVNSLKGLTEKQIRNLVLKCIVEDSRLDVNDIEYLEKQKKDIFDKGGFLEYADGELSANIAGFENIKKWINDRKMILNSSNLKIQPPKGILITGIPGCGKSLCAKVIGKMLDYPLYRLDPSVLYSKYIGESEENVRMVFDTVDKLSPVCLWIDEIEKIFSNDDSSSDGGLSKRIFSLFLVWFSERKNNSFVVATSNDIGKLPSEFIRKGRFDEIFFIDLPTMDERKKVFEIHLKKRNIDFSKFDLDKLAKLTEGFSGSEIEQLLISSFYSSHGNITFKSIVNEISKTTPLSNIKKSEFEAIRSWAKERSIPPA